MADSKKSTSRQVNLSRPYMFNGTTYGPGRQVTVPSDFPEIDDQGDVVFEEGSRAAENRARVRRFATAPNTGGVNTGEAGGGAGGAGGGGTVSGYPRAQLEEMKKDELAAIAAEKGITVTRGDNADGEPRKDDYVEALSQEG